MGSGSRKLGERVSAIHCNDPDQIRREVVEVLQEHITCDMALFFRCVYDEESDGYTFTGPTAVGDPEFVRQILPHAEGRAYNVPWLPERIDPDEIDRFVRVPHAYRDSYLDYEVNREILVPLGVKGQIRAVLYDGAKLVGWLGMMRRGRDGEFRRAEQQQLAKVVGKLKANLLAADALEDEMVEAIFAVVDSQGQIQHASRPFVRWCDEDRREYLRRRICKAETTDNAVGTEIFGGLQVRVTRLDGTDSVRYLVGVERTELIKLQPRLWLTNRQREIAEYVVAGATSREIADTLELSLHTVKTHMKNIYRRLGVGSRVEMVKMLGAGAGCS